MKPQICTTLILLALTGAPATVLADTLALPPETHAMEPAHPMPAEPMHPAESMPAESMPMETAPAPGAVYSVEMPARGMTMERVEDLFGSPLERQPPVGEPPITRWIYPDFVVVFEHKWVINSVLTRGQPQAR